MLTIALLGHGPECVVQMVLAGVGAAASKLNTTRESMLQMAWSGGARLLTVTLGSRVRGRRAASRRPSTTQRVGSGKLGGHGIHHLLLCI